MRGKRHILPVDTTLPFFRRRVTRVTPTGRRCCLSAALDAQGACDENAPPFFFNGGGIVGRSRTNNGHVLGTRPISVLAGRNSSCSFSSFALFRLMMVFRFCPQYSRGNTSIPHPDPGSRRSLPVHRRREASAGACQGLGAKPVRGGKLLGLFDTDQSRMRTPRIN